jgi:UDP-glucose 4-epimerase
VNLALGTNSTLLDLIALMEQALGHSLDLNHQPERVGDVRASQADSSRLRELFPDVSVAPLLDGVDATIDWFRTPPDYAGKL